MGFCFNLETSYFIHRFRRKTYSETCPNRYCNCGYFRWGRISWKCWQDLSCGDNFHNISLINLLNLMGFIFPDGNFTKKVISQKKCENYPNAKMSTFTLLILTQEKYKTFTSFLEIWNIYTPQSILFIVIQVFMAWGSLTTKHFVLYTKAWD